METNIILNHNQVVQKIKRIAFEIYEHNFNQEEVVFAGIVGTGYRIAELLEKEFNKIADINTKVIKVTIDKEAPLQTFIELDCGLEELEKKAIVVVDDVLNTGKTLAYSLKPFLNTRVSKLQVAILVDRNHRIFPVSPDFIGYELSTTENERIHVELEREGDYLISVTY